MTNLNWRLIVPLVWSVCSTIAVLCEATGVIDYGWALVTAPFWCPLLAVFSFYFCKEMLPKEDKPSLPKEPIAKIDQFKKDDD